MYNLFVTLLRGRSADAAEAVTDANALPILRQQLRDCADGVEAARRSVAMVMACAEREKTAAARIAVQCADLESRALAALAKGRDDLASEAASTIAHLEAEAATTARALATYETEIVSLRHALSDAENRLRTLQQGQRLAIATSETQRVRGTAPASAASSLSRAEATLQRLQANQTEAEARRIATLELSASGNADILRDRLAAAGCGAPLRPDAAAVLERLRSKAA